MAHSQGLLRRRRWAAKARQPGVQTRAFDAPPPHPAGYLLGKAGVPKYAIVTALAGAPTPSLAAFVEALKVGGGLGWAD